MAMFSFVLLVLAVVSSSKAWTVPSVATARAAINRLATTRKTSKVVSSGLVVTTYRRSSGHPQENCFARAMQNGSHEWSRQTFLKNSILWTAATTAAILPSAARAEDEVTLPNGVKYRVVKSGDGPQPLIGELAAIRFAAYWNDIKIDDIFETPEPYYTRIGSGGLIQGVEQTLPLMRTGDRWLLTVPSYLAFGSSGRKASAGKPRIPADATIVFDVEIIGVPGREVELIDLIGDA